MESPKEKDVFNLVARAKSLTHAVRGMRVFIATTHNAWVQLVLGAFGIVMGIAFHISSMEWIALIFAIGILLAAEAFNTAIEIDMNLTSPDYHPYARDTKDVAAGAVLITAVMALAVGLIIFLPKILALLS